MANPTIIYRGKSGKQYTFTIFPINTNFADVAGNYVFMKERSDGSYAPPIYFGITNSFKDRFDTHHKWRCITGQGATHIGAHVNSRQADRESEELDLLSNYTTVCNTQNN